MGGEKVILLDLNRTEETGPTVSSYATCCYLPSTRTVNLLLLDNRCELTHVESMVEEGWKGVEQVKAR